MDDVATSDFRRCLSLIPVEVRPLVSDWLIAQSRHADSIASRLSRANAKIRDHSTASRILYWQHVSSAAKYYAAQLDQSGAIPRRTGEAKTDESRDA